jgi:CheY-like chemotaxis protein
MGVGINGGINRGIDGGNAADAGVGREETWSADHAGRAANASLTGPFTGEASGRFRMNGRRTETCFRLDLAEAPGRTEVARSAVGRTEAGQSEIPGRPNPFGGPVVEDRSVTILLVEDDVVDVTAIRRSFWRQKILNPLVIARHGIEALDILRGQNGREKIQSPYLALLDLNMPRMGGIEFLRELRGDPALRRTLVFVMTTSMAAADRLRAYDMNVAGYFLKHPPGKDFAEALTLIERYLRAVEFPD